MMYDVHVVRCKLPGHTYACVVSSVDPFTFTVLVDMRLSEERQRKEVLHELRHILKGDLFSHQDVQSIEFSNHLDDDDIDWSCFTFYWHVLEEGWC